MEYRRSLATAVVADAMNGRFVPSLEARRMAQSPAHASATGGIDRAFRQSESGDRRKAMSPRMDGTRSATCALLVLNRQPDATFAAAPVQRLEAFPARLPGSPDGAARSASATGSGIAEE